MSDETKRDHVEREHCEWHTARDRAWEAEVAALRVELDEFRNQPVYARLAKANAELRATLARVEELLPRWRTLQSEAGLGNNDSDFADGEAFEHCIEELEITLRPTTPKTQRKAT